MLVFLFVNGAHTRKKLREDHGQYAKTELAKECWAINPDVVVTRGAIETPEQETPESPIAGTWESCYTLGDQWQFRPTNENYKSASETIRRLIEIRAKGGNFLLNFGPERDGSFPPDQLAILNEISLWMFINQEAFENTEPCPVIRENKAWFLQNRESGTIYAFLDETNWEYGTRKKYTFNH
jgi:alpha-L-fucosidase